MWYLLFAQNWMQAFGINDGAQLAHFWTLAIEEQFYLVWPAAVWFLTVQTLRRVAMVLLLLVELVRAILWFSHATPLFLYFNTVTRLDAFALGALLSLAPTTVRILCRFAPVLIPVAVGVAFFSPDSALPVLLLVLCGCTVALAASSKGALLRGKLLRTFGKYSFSMYVFHYLLHGALVPLAKRVPPRLFACAAMVGGTCVTFGMAWLSWRIIEQPALKLKRFFRYADAARS